MARPLKDNRRVCQKCKAPAGRWHEAFCQRCLKAEGLDVTRFFFAGTSECRTKPGMRSWVSQDRLAREF